MDMRLRATRRPACSAVVAAVVVLALVAAAKPLAAAPAPASPAGCAPPDPPTDAEPPPASAQAIPTTWPGGGVPLAFRTGTDPAILFHDGRLHLVFHAHTMWSDLSPYRVEYWTSPDGFEWFNRTVRAMSLNKSGDLFIHDGSVYLLDEGGRLWAGESIPELRFTGVRLPTSEGSVYRQNGTWYVFSAEGQWRGRRPAIGANVTLWTAPALHGPWNLRGRPVQRPKASWGTGDPSVWVARGQYHLMADAASRQPWYRIALWTAPVSEDGPPAEPSAWRYRGRITRSPGGDAQVARRPDGPGLVMVNEFARPPLAGIRLRFWPPPRFNFTERRRLRARAAGLGVAPARAGFDGPSACSPPPSLTRSPG